MHDGTTPCRGREGGCAAPKMKAVPRPPSRPSVHASHWEPSNLGRSATEAQLGLEFELQFEFESEIEFSFEIEFEPNAPALEKILSVPDRSRNHVENFKSRFNPFQNGVQNVSKMDSRRSPK